MILSSPFSGFRDFLNDCFRRHRLSPRVLLELDDLEGIKEMVRVGLGITFLPESTVRSGLSSGRLKTCPLGEEFFCTTFLISLPEKFWTRPMKELARLLEEKYALSGLCAHAHAYGNVRMHELARAHEDACTLAGVRMPTHTYISAHAPTPAVIKETPAFFSPSCDRRGGQKK